MPEDHFTLCYCRGCDKDMMEPVRIRANAEIAQRVSEILANQLLFLISSLLPLVSCSNDKPNLPPAVCVAGTLSCPCFADATCTQSGAKRLFCDRGYCVPDDCPAGSEGCRCYPNATCDPLGGVPMTCDGNLCAKTQTPDPGTVNGPCLQDKRCGQYGGKSLQCVSGTCQVGDCPSGRLGCPCNMYGNCGMLGGQPVICAKGACVPPNCSPGDLGCPCPDAGACNDGVECALGFCRAPGLVMKLNAVGARACDVVLSLKERAAVKATFGSSVLGQVFQRGTTLALSFAAREDADLSGQIAALERVPTWWGDGASTWSEPLTVTSAVCYDRTGMSVSEAYVNVE